MLVVIVFGLPGSGKSFFASRLADLINASYVNSDRLRLEMFRNRTYSDEEKKAVYQVMLEMLRQSIDQGKNLVLDATFHRSDTRIPFILEMKGKGHLFFIEVWAQENIVRERLKVDRPYSEADFEVYKLLKQQWEPLNEPHLMLESTNGNIESMCQRAAIYLQQKDDKGPDQ